MLSDLQIMNKWASVLTGYKSTGERIFEFARAIEAEVRKDYEALIRDAIDRVAPAPQPAVPEGYVLVPLEPTQEMEDAAYRNSSTYGSGPGADYRAMLAAAPPTAQEARVPLSEEQKRELVTDYFAEDWAIDKAMNLLSDFERRGITAAQKETP